MTRPGEPRADHDDDADEADDQPDEPVDPHRFVGRKKADRTIAKSGTGEVRIAASDDSTDCSAQVISRNGIVMLMTAITSRWP